ncbi:hypothetical protein [Prescottella agglutinans]|uniref:Uncharacterized protein n=1 Tax=Prescottella agglutinans TaxID=1644129 RepID=A0ABT6MGA9_9NOCA|nr:hypothetical protein [Prescottella agglutinans]MDH6282831.1 hypothetical protein [Prescottella agglutinans]
MATIRISIDGNITDEKVKGALDALKVELDAAGIQNDWERVKPGARCEVTGTSPNVKMVFTAPDGTTFEITGGPNGS